MKIQLRPYQIDGINQIKEMKNFGLFWQQRLGKTIVAIKSIEEYKKVIIAVPNNTIFHWYQEIMNNIYIQNLELLNNKSKSKRVEIYRKFDNCNEMWIIASYDTLAQDFLKECHFKNKIDYLVLDEAHFLRNIKSKRTKGINKLRNYANYALAISGTPAVNSAIDLLKIFKFLYPESNYGHKYVYKKKYFKAVKSKDSKKINWELKSEMIKEWEKFLSSMCDIKKVYDHLKWLPRNIEKEILLEMDSIQRMHYDKMLFEAKRLITSKDKDKVENNAITQIIRLQQLCLDPKILNIDAPSVKIKWLENYLNNLLSEDDNEFVIVFTNFSSLYEKHKFNLNPEFNYAYLTGKQNNIERQNIIHQFQSRKIRVLFANIKVAALGLTLDECTCTIFLDKSWNPVNNEQASFRMVDTKQKTLNKPKLNINVVCSNSIDDKINQVLKSKKDKTNVVYELEKYLME